MVDIDAWGNDAATREAYEWARGEAWLEERDIARAEEAERMDGREPTDWNRITQDEMIDNEPLWPEGGRFYDHDGKTTSTELQWRDHNEEENPREQ